jgi:hypothetical protein
MHDGYLVKSLAPDYPWIEELYKKASGYIHLSDTHVFSAFAKVHPDEARIELVLTGTDNECPDQVYLDAIRAYRRATWLFFDHLRGWIELKGRRTQPRHP